MNYFIISRNTTAIYYANRDDCPKFINLINHPGGFHSPLHFQLCAISFWPWFYITPFPFVKDYTYISFHNSELLHVVSWNQSQFSVFRSPPLLCEAKSFFDLKLRLDSPELPRHLVLSRHGWDYKYKLPWQGFYIGSSIELRFSCLLVKYITRKAVCTVPNHCLFNVHQPGNISFRLPFISLFLLTSKKLYSLFLFLHKTQLLFLFWFSSLLTMQRSVVSNPAPLDTQPLESNVFV